MRSQVPCILAVLIVLEESHICECTIIIWLAHMNRVSLRSLAENKGVSIWRFLLELAFFYNWSTCYWLRKCGITAPKPHFYASLKLYAYIRVGIYALILILT